MLWIIADLVGRLQDIRSIFVEGTNDMLLIYLQMLDTEEEKHKFEQLYELYKKQMMRIAFRILQNQQDAEDAVHAAFVKIAKNFHKVEEVESPRTRSFLFTIAEHEAINLYHRNKSHRTIELQDWDDGPTIQYDGKVFLTDCVMKLPSRYRDVILLKYYHGYSIKEIAQILGISDANASKLDQRAKRRLSELYDQ